MYSSTYLSTLHLYSDSKTLLIQEYLYNFTFLEKARKFADILKYEKFIDLFVIVEPVELSAVRDSKKPRARKKLIFNSKKKHNR